MPTSQGLMNIATRVIGHGNDLVLGNENQLNDTYTKATTRKYKFRAEIERQGKALNSITGNLDAGKLLAALTPVSWNLMSEIAA